MPADASLDLGEMSREDALLSAIGPVTGLKVIDIGCGEGRMAKALATRGATVAGYDPFIPETDWIAHGDGSYRLAHGVAEAIPEPDASADMVVFVFSLHHVPKAKLGAALAEARRVLKPGGHLCVAEPLAEGAGQYVSELYHDETEVRRDAQAALATYAVPLFDVEKVLNFYESKTIPDWETFANQQRANMRFNDFKEEDVINDAVRGRFCEMLDKYGGRFDTKIKLNVYG
jgi:ubiquinone/menaquinone biosynthesis C-methylase UbiE